MTARPGSEKSLRPLWLAVGWMGVLLIIYLSLTPVPIKVHADEGDKLLHMAAYLVLMSWFVNLYETPPARILCAAGCIALGVGLECAQGWTGYRSFEVADMTANTAGVVVAWILAPPRLPNYLRLTERIVRARYRN